MLYLQVQLLTCSLEATDSTHWPHANGILQDSIAEYLHTCSSKLFCCSLISTSTLCQCVSSQQGLYFLAQMLHHVCVYSGGTELQWQTSWMLWDPGSAQGLCLRGPHRLGLLSQQCILLCKAPALYMSTNPKTSLILAYPVSTATTRSVHWSLLWVLA